MHTWLGMEIQCTPYYVILQVVITAAAGGLTHTVRLLLRQLYDVN